MPHSAFKGQTPDEMYFETGRDIHEKLHQARLNAREKRKETNLATTCETCTVKKDAA